MTETELGILVSSFVAGGLLGLGIGDCMGYRRAWREVTDIMDKACPWWREAKQRRDAMNRNARTQ